VVIVEQVGLGLNLPTVKYRQLHGDMIEVFKIIHNIYDAKVSPQLNMLNERSYTRGNNYKFLNHTFHYNLFKKFYNVRPTKWMLCFHRVNLQVIKCTSLPF